MLNCLKIGHISFRDFVLVRFTASVITFACICQFFHEIFKINLKLHLNLILQIGIFDYGLATSLTAKFQNFLENFGIKPERGRREEKSQVFC